MLLKDVGRWLLHPDFHFRDRVIARLLRLVRHERSVPHMATPMPAIGQPSTVVTMDSSPARWVRTPSRSRGVCDLDTDERLEQEEPDEPP
jgi:hypothetical protein